VVRDRRNQRRGGPGGIAHLHVRLLHARHRGSIDRRYAIHGIRAVRGGLPGAALVPAEAQLDAGAVLPPVWSRQPGLQNFPHRVWNVYGVWLGHDADGLYPGIHLSADRPTAVRRATVDAGDRALSDCHNLLDPKRLLWRCVCRGCSVLHLCNRLPCRRPGRYQPRGRVARYAVNPLFCSH
jgi:hypothetical protein